MWTIPSLEPEYIARLSWLDSTALISPWCAWLMLKLGSCFTCCCGSDPDRACAVLHPRRFLSFEALTKILSSSSVAKDVTTSRWGCLMAVYTCSWKGKWSPRPTGTMLWLRQPMKSWFWVDLRAKMSMCFSMSSTGVSVFLRSQTSKPPWPAENKYLPSLENSSALISPLCPLSVAMLVMVVMSQI